MGLALAAAAQARAALWVSPAGDDRNPGTEDEPLRTIERARDVVRTLNREMTDDITVFIGGTYRVVRPIEFGPEDSATNGFSIVYTAAPGEHPVVSGGCPVAGWTVADRSRNLWWAPAPEGLGDTRTLFVGGVPAALTRGRLIQAFSRSPSGAAAPEPSAQWRNPGDVVFTQPGPGAIWSERTGTPPIFAVNAFELLGKPGEWYFDRPSRRIFYRPRAGEDMTRGAQAGAAPALIDAKGTRDRPLAGLIFKGIRFELTSPPRPPGAPSAAVHFSFARDIQFLEDEFVYLGTAGLHLGPGLSGASVEGCAFAQVASAALRLEGASQVRVSNSRFSYVATDDPDGAAIDLGSSETVAIEHNQIDHYPRFAIASRAARSGSYRAAMNLISAPAIDFEGRPREAGYRDPAPPDAGVSQAYRSLLAESYGGATVPRPPGRVSAAAGSRLAYVTWDPPCEDGGSPVTAYTVASAGGATMTVTAAEFRAKGYAIFFDLENGYAVNFSVAAVNATGTGPPSVATANVLPERKRKLKPPEAPRVALAAGPGGEPRLEITPPAADGGRPVLAYSVTPMPSGQRVVLEGWDVVHASASDPVVRAAGAYPLEPGSTVAVAARNSSGEGKAAVLKLP